MLNVTGESAGDRIAQRQKLDVAHLCDGSAHRLSHLNAVAVIGGSVGRENRSVKARPLADLGVVFLAHLNIACKTACGKHDCGALGGNNGALGTFAGGADHFAVLDD
ncbi:hypothetical protein SDC9_132644 [bioreactor metagenome]|uniref:Uncharacterized protein n=1 Tax=bioreactor metagenome TaxID=1076179 RepID=A0A645D9F1_9ZZZZ